MTVIDYIALFFACILGNLFCEVVIYKSHKLPEQVRKLESRVQELEQQVQGFEGKIEEAYDLGFKDGQNNMQEAQG